MGHILTGGWNFSSSCDGASQSSCSDFPSSAASHREMGRCWKERPTRRLRAGLGSGTICCSAPRYRNQKHRKCPAVTRMALSSCPISCSKSRPQEGKARNGRVPLLAFNPPKRGNSGPKPSSLPSHRARQWVQRVSGSSEGESSMGRKS